VKEFRFKEIKVDKKNIKYLILNKLIYKIKNPYLIKVVYCSGFLI